MAEGLSMLLTDAPTHPDAPLWQASCEAYADYLRGVSQLIEPYGILPSAVYEVDNTDYKNLYHEGEQVGLPSLEEYNAQVRNGIPLSKNFYLRSAALRGIRRKCCGSRARRNRNIRK